MLLFLEISEDETIKESTGMATVSDLLQSKNLTSSIKDFEDVPSLVVTSKGSVTRYNISRNVSRNVDVNVA